MLPLHLFLTNAASSATDRRTEATLRLLNRGFHGVKTLFEALELG